jgi:hypothetical protein
MTQKEHLPVVFERHARDVLASENGLRHEWLTSPDKTRLIIPRANDTGFTVEAQAETYGLYAFAEGWHSGAWELASRKETFEYLCSQFLGFIRTLLSPDAWLEVRYAGHSPYKWTMTYGVEGGVESESTGSLFFNYFGRRSARVLQNKHLPARYGIKRVT